MIKQTTTKVMAEKWGISDRRVRMLCEEGRIPGAKKKGNRYLIPDGAPKPTDFRGYRNLNMNRSRIGFLAVLDAYRDEVYRQDRKTLLWSEILETSFAEELYWQHLMIDIVEYRKRNDVFPKDGSWIDQRNCADAAKYIARMVCYGRRMSKKAVKEIGFLLEDPWRKSEKYKSELSNEWNVISNQISPFILRYKRSREHPIEKATIFYLKLIVHQPFPREKDMMIPLLLDFFLLKAGYPVIDSRIRLGIDHERALEDYKRTENPNRMIKYIAEHLTQKLEGRIATNKAGISKKRVI